MGAERLEYPEELREELRGSLTLAVQLARRIRDPGGRVASLEAMLKAVNEDMEKRWPIYSAAGVSYYAFQLADINLTSVLCDSP
jgi:hypothetical protein